MSEAQLLALMAAQIYAGIDGSGVRKPPISVSDAVKVAASILDEAEMVSFNRIHR